MRHKNKAEALIHQTEKALSTVFRKDSVAAKGLTELFGMFEAKEDYRNLDSFRILLETMRASGISQFSEISLKYVAPVHSKDEKHIARCCLCPATLRHGHQLCVQGVKHDGVAVRANQNYIITVGNEHLDHLKMLAQAIQDKSFEQYIDHVAQTKKKAASVDGIADLALALGIDNATASSMRYVQKFTDIYGASESALNALRSKGVNRNRMNWLADNIKDMPQDVVSAHNRYYGGWYTAQDVATIDAAIREGMPLPIQGMLPDVKQEIAFLASDNCLVDPERKARLLQELQNAPTYQHRFVAPKVSYNSLEQLLADEEGMVPEAMAASARLQLRGRLTAREEHNSAIVQRYETKDTSMTVLLRVCRELYQKQLDMLKESEGEEWMLNKKEYYTLKNIFGLLDDAGRKDERTALIELVPMFNATRIFGTVYALDAKTRLGKDLKARYVPAANFSDVTMTGEKKLERIRKTAMPTSEYGAMNEEIAVLGKQGLSVEKYRAFASLCDNDELVPYDIARKDKKGCTFEALYNVVKDAVKIPASVKEDIAYFERLGEAFHISYPVSGHGWRRQRSYFNPSAFKDSVYMLECQKQATDYIRQALQEAGLYGLSDAELRQKAEGLASKQIYVKTANLREPQRFNAASHHGIDELKADGGLVDALAALTTKQDPKLYEKVLKVQLANAQTYTSLIKGEAIAAPSLVRDAQTCVEGCKANKALVDSPCALRPEQHSLYARNLWFDIHAESGGKDAKGEVIYTFGKNHDKIPGLFFNRQSLRFDARGVHKDKLEPLLRDVAYNNLMKGRDVYINIDAARYGKR